ncbi:hypothetical protein H5410_005094, partial [Solanum commersonii]
MFRFGHGRKLLSLDPRGPHATRWYTHFSWTNTTKHVLKVFRDALDSMTEDHRLPDYCRIGRDIWRVRDPIFCWDVIEVHLSDRHIFTLIVGEDQIPIESWSMHNGCLFGTNDFNIFVMHQYIVNHFGTMTLTLFGLDSLLVFLLVILLYVLNNNK